MLTHRFDTNQVHLAYSTDTPLDASLIRFMELIQCDPTDTPQTIAAQPEPEPLDLAAELFELQQIDPLWAFEWERFLDTLDDSEKPED